MLIMPDKKLAIFDFCGTLISFQTADRYVQFCVERLQENKAVQRRHCMIRIMDKLRIFKIYNHIRSNNWRKRMILWQLKGVSYETCDQLAKKYFEEELLPNVVQPLIEKLKAHLANGDRVCILSGGYDVYIKYFAHYFGVEEIISSRIAFSDGMCMGRMEGKDCMRKNKLEYIRPLIQNEKTICYTDSKSDLPLLELVDKPIVVSKGGHQKWAQERKYTQIIWI
jgi:HAD superfamily hydrolase (TIGR01490 family)